MRSRRWLPAAVVMTALLFPMLERLAAQSSTGIMISEFRFRGPNGINDEFIELFNGGLAPVNVGGWLIRVSNNNVSPTVVTRATIPAGTVINRGCYYLVVNNNSAGGFSGGVTPDRTYTISYPDDGGVAVTRANLSIVDQVGHGANGAFGEGTRLPVLLDNVNRGIQRLPSATAGYVDTDNNAADFREIQPGTPQNSSSPCLIPGELSISGSAAPAPVDQGETVTIFATVTAATLPPSTNLQVTGDLSAIGGPASATFADNGVLPDVTPNDNIFTASVAVPPAHPAGPQSLPLTLTDAQGRSATTTVLVTVNEPLVIYLPHDIQGPGATSPFPTGTAVIVRGVVTARKSDGFFLQTQTGMEDADANTSEGHFVFVSAGAPDEAQVGHLVQVRGSVAEFIPANDPASAPRTELNLVTSVIDLGASAMPAPYALTEVEVSDAGTLDQLERFEGMRVMVASLTSITGTGGDTNEADATATSDGTFYAVITGQARPFREAGVESGNTVLPCAIGPCNIPIFDGNPERLRVDSDALEGTTAVDLSTGAVMTGVVGPLDFGFRTYTLLPEATLSPVGGSAMTSAPVAAADQFTIASFNMERFFDAANDSGNDVVMTPLAYETRLTKASLAIRTVLNNPDVLGVQEVENLGVLQDLATRIDADALAAGGPAPEYAAWLFEGWDQDGLDVGFLVKGAAGRISVTSVEQAGLDTTFVDPGDNSVDLLHDHPPVVLRAFIQGPVTSMPQSVTVIVNHLRSVMDAGLDNETGVRVRAQRRAQAEFLATYIQDRQLNDPNEAIVSIGDYNAFGFNDGYVDTLGTILGTPAPEDQVAAASADLVSPDLVNLADFIAESERYSSLRDGNAELLDHAIVTANLVAQFAGLVYPRVNADFAESLRGDATTPQRLSTHDPAVAYFSFPPDLEAPVFSFTPQDQEVEATSAAGASVTYAAPTATDNLDGDVDVACEPASGATLPLGNTGVTCTAADAAGNAASVSFTVTVQDTTAPQLTVPADVSEQASSPAGHVVSFTASATDAVTASPLVTCAPASGSTFPIGVTLVHCSASDAAGNSASDSFAVTITAVVPGRMHGAGTVGSGATRVSFRMDVRESADYADRGSLVVKVGANDFSAGISDVEFADSADASTTGQRPLPDSVTFAGSGTWNGDPGYTYQAVATDHGEPGRGRDTFTVVVRAPDGAVVASSTGTLSTGNIQTLR